MSDSSLGEPSEFEDSGSEYIPSDEERRLPSSVNLSEQETTTDNPSDAVPGPSQPQDSLSLKEKRKLSRKRLRHHSEWKRETAKKARAAGEEYLNVRGKVVPAKKFYDGDCTCPKKCHSLFTLEERKLIFDNFYKLINFDLQTAFIFGKVKVEPKLRTYYRRALADSPRRKNTRTYLLPKAGVDVVVCKTFFKKSLGVSDGRISRAVRYKNTGFSTETTAPLDKRGKQPCNKKTSEEAVNGVISFINKFPTYRSHYRRINSPNAQYLSPDLCIAKLYSIYKEEMRNNAVSRFIFSKIFSERFNLHFRQPYSDTCKKCDAFNVKLRHGTQIEKNQVALQKELHLRKVESARSGLKKDIIFAQTLDNDTTIFAFDLMKTLPTPNLSTGVVYYKRQLWTYCLGIHNLTTNQAYMYTWHEGLASRGPPEIGSCLLHFFKNLVTTKNVIMYSDQCGGQNRNIKIAAICNFVTSNNQYKIEQIDHKFLVSGHSYLPCDRDFGLIEREKRYHENIYIPDDWVKVIASAKKKHPKFHVIKMTQNDFRCTRKLEQLITNRKLDDNETKNERRPVEWLKFQWIRLCKSHPYKIFYKYTNVDDDLIAPFLSVNVEKRKTRNSDLQNIELDLLYPEGRTIEKNKMKDLQSLFPYIPEIHHSFYNNLKTNEGAVDDDVDRALDDQVLEEVPET